VFELLEPTHLMFVFVVALVLFGPKRLLEMSRELGQYLRRIQEYKEELKDELTTSPPTPSHAAGQPAPKKPPSTTVAGTAENNKKKG
jgi:Sec-independent protein translocase protein TatA